MVSCHPGVPERFSGDPTRLAQVLTNLGSNAMKFTEHGEVIVRSTAEAMTDGRTLLRVEVIDTGVGVDHVDGKNLFAPFTQADASTTRIHGGTGLGLAISRDIVEALGGEIGLAPNPDGGSIFWFTAVFEPPSGHLADLDDEEATRWLAGRHVLVVDDNEHNRLILEEQLNWWQVRSQAARSADEALVLLASALASGDPFEAVLTDMAMPLRDGFDFAREIRSNAAFDDVEILMLTSLSSPDPAQIEEVRIAECLTKPVLAGVLRTALLRHVAKVAPGPRHESLHERPEAVHRILVVEDNSLNQIVASGILESLGCTRGPRRRRDRGSGDPGERRELRRGVHGRADAAPGRLRHHARDQGTGASREQGPDHRDDGCGGRGRARALSGRWHGRLPDQAL